MTMITDGSGACFNAKVDPQLRLHTHALNVDISQLAAIQGDSFGVSTDIVTLTSATESGVFHIKNTSDDDLLIIEQFLILGASVGGSGVTTVTYYTNATAGTLISNASPIVPGNRRLADSRLLGADTYSGMEGDTISGGLVSAFASAGFFNTTPFVLPSGVTLAISITPPAGNTSLPVTFGINLIAKASNPLFRLILLISVIELSSSIS